MRAEADMSSNRIVYVAWHPSFAPVEKGQIIPEYVAVFDADKAFPRWEAAL